MNLRRFRLVWIPLTLVLLAGWAFVLAAENSTPSPPSGDLPSGIITPSLGADPEALKTNPIAEKCFKCHGTDIASYEWALSGHSHNLASLRKAPNARDSCLGCHSSGYNPKFKNQWTLPPEAQKPTLHTAVNEVACASCHSHGSKEPHYVLVPVAELCGSCHKMDCGCAGAGIIHQSQTEMFLGKGGKGVPLTPSKHAEEMKGNCAVCHMYRPKGMENVALKSGGHTFKATLESCVPCHEDAEARYAKNKAEMTELYERVHDALEHADPSVVGSEVYKAAKLNYDMVHGDGGFGLHNPTYARALLEQSLIYLGVSHE